MEDQFEIHESKSVSALSGSYTKNEIQILKQIFDKYDVDGSGAPACLA